MKRSFPLGLCLLLVSARLLVAADPLTEAAAVAAQRDAEERFKRLAADVQTLMENQEALQKRQDDFRRRLEKFADEIRSLKEDQTRSAANLVTREDLRKYVEKLKEVDEKREADKKVILESIKELAKAPPIAAVPDPKVASRRNTPEPSEEPPFIYTVKKNDRLLDIVLKSNEYLQEHGFPKVTVDQVLKANPRLKPDRLLTGQKIRIPVLAKESK